jgi:uncharacterized coiled-coil protein SlyX
MNITEKVSNIINKLEHAVSYEDWKEVEKVIDELTYLYEEMESSFPMDEWEEEVE